MFNSTTIVQGKKEYVPYEKTVIVHEHKAPTDESIKILNEFKQKALEDTMLLVEVKNTEFNFVVRYVQNPTTLEQQAVFKFMFNGKEIVKIIDINQKQLFLSQAEMIQFLITEFKRIIAESVEEVVVKLSLKELIK